MNVTIINPEEVKKLYKNHGEFACTCYDTPKKYAEKVGKSCNKSQHMSGSRCEYIKFEIEGDRGTLEQMMRHEIGVRYDEVDKYAYSDRIEMVVDVNPNNIVKNMQSFRYVDKNDFTYYVPSNIEKCEPANKKYVEIMKQIDDVRKEIRDLLIKNGVDSKQAVEDANFVLPRATNLKLVIAFTPEALIHFMHKRLCTRAQEPIRLIAVKMKQCVNEILPEFAKELQPHCQHLLWCPEGTKSCGIKPSREELINKLKDLQ